MPMTRNKTERGVAINRFCYRTNKNVWITNNRCSDPDYVKCSGCLHNFKEHEKDPRHEYGFTYRIPIDRKDDNLLSLRSPSSAGHKREEDSILHTAGKAPLSKQVQPGQHTSRSKQYHVQEKA